MLEFTSQCTLHERHIAVSDQSQGRTRQSKITLCFESKLSLGVSAGIVLWARWDRLSGSLVRCGGKQENTRSGVVPRAGGEHPSALGEPCSSAPLQITCPGSPPAHCAGTHCATSRLFSGV